MTEEPTPASKILGSHGPAPDPWHTRPVLDAGLPRRIDTDPEKVERGLAQLVLTIVELLRELMERQALHRIEGGTLSEDEVERLGQAFIALRARMEELKETFDLTDEDLQLDLGPLNDLL